MQNGFTMVELITVMVILGIISAIAIPRLLSSGSTFASATYRQTVVAALRHAQKSAVGHRRLVCANFTTTTVTLTIAAANPAAACNTTLASPDGSAYASSDASVTATDTATGQAPAALFFLPDGQITDNSGVPATLTITIANLGNITVNGNTGYVE
ncbi:Tfp pilus assembly protein FimT/FimU [Pseudoduganella sp. UC29_106]|uniref:pilus assembly FimT family protein n=1 Tax=Pseudoduganella sp. UC29_106 TaxID=3374553 RepID=UPI003757782B